MGSMGSGRHWYWGAKKLYQRLPIHRRATLETGGLARPASIFRLYVVPPGRGGVFYPHAH